MFTDPMAQRDRRVHAVRRRLLEAQWAGGVAMLHARTHLSKHLIVDLLHLVSDRPDPPMVLLGLYDAWGGGSGHGSSGYMDFVSFVHHRLRQA